MYRPIVQYTVQVQETGKDLDLELELEVSNVNITVCMGPLGEGFDGL